MTTMTENRRIAEWDSVRDGLATGDEVDFFTLSGVEPGTTVYLYMAGEAASLDSRIDVIRSDGTPVTSNDVIFGDGTPEGFDITGILGQNSGYNYQNAFVSFEYQPGMVIKASNINLFVGEYELYASTGQLILNSQSPTSGDDVIEGTGGADMIDGLAGGDIILGLAGNDTLTGGAGSDFLTGGDGTDTLDGGAGSDRLGGGAGADQLDGGSGQDTADYEASDVGVTVNLATGQSSGGHAEGDRLSNIESITGSAHADILTGDRGANRLAGLAGNDTLNGGAGADRLTGGAGFDMLDGGSGQDTASYAGSDVGVTVNLATSQVSGGQAEGDTLRNIEGITGSAHDDSLTGDGRANRLRGLEGIDELDGGAGNDWLTGGDGNDTLNGGAGSDRLGGGDGADMLDGGSGQDTAAYAASGAGVTVNLATGQGSGGQAEGDRLSNIEGIVGSAHDDSLTGDGGANRLRGLAGDDELDGGAGDDALEGGDGADRLTGGAGSDILDGGSGQDTASYADSDVGVAVYLERGRGSGGHAHGDTLRNIEDVEGSAQNDFLTGDAGANRLSGGGGNDRLSGGAGDDTLEGSDGNDVLDGGAGADQLDGGSGLDIAVYAASGAGVTVNLETGQGSGGQAEGDRLSNIEGIVGSAHDDILTGGGGANGLIGGDGNDVLEGGAGADFLAGSSGQDTASYAGSDAGVTVDLGTGTAQGGHAQGDTLRNIENLRGSAHADSLTGDGGANRLVGLAGDDELDGGDGDDTLEGGAGDDRLTGGDGSDRFRFVSGESGSDTITDFDPQNDTLVFAPGVSAEAFATINALRQAASVNADGHLEITRPGAGTITLLNIGDANQLTNDNVAFQDGEGRRVLTGTSGDDISSALNGFTNSNGNNMPLIGTDGDDVIRGLAGNDDLRGGAGDDVLDGGAGRDFLRGGAGNDVFTFRPVTGAPSTDVPVDFDPSEDRLEFVGFDTGSLAAFKQTISSSDGAIGPSRDNPDEISIYHTSGFTFSLPTADSIHLGGFDRDNLLASLTDDNVRFYTENGERLWNGTDGADELTGTDGDDVIRGLAGNDTLEGGGGGDTLDGGAGADQLDGGSGQDTAVYGASGAGVTVNLETGQGSGGHAEGDTLRNIESITGSAHADSLTGDGGDNRLAGHAGDDTLNGGAGNDRLGGNDDNDTLNGGAGDDRLGGGDGADILDGGSGQDTAAYGVSDAGVTVNLATGQGNGGHAEGDMLSNIENLRGSAHADSLTGDGDDNRLSGGDGADVLEGGAGSDILAGGSGQDTASYAGSGAGVTVNLDTGQGSGGDAEGDTLSNIEGIRGSAHADSLTGDGSDNGLSGGDGADVLSGGVGDDTLEGGAGDDRLTGGDGSDRFRFVSGESGSDTITDFDPQNDTLVFVAPGVSEQTFADIDALRQAASVNADGHLEITRPGAGTITLLNIGNANQLTTDNVAFQDGEGRRVLTGTSGDDTLAGTDGDDAIRGLAGNDDLRGGAGDDVLNGGAGGDFLQGGAGHDVFTFRPVTGDVSNDLLVGFNPSEDRLEFVGFDAGSLAAFKQSITSTNANNEFIFGPARNDADSQQLYSNGFRFSLPTADSIYLSDFSDSDNLLAALTDDNVRFYTESGERLWNGTDGADELTGTDGDDVIRGLADNDTLNGGAGNDTLDGGAGNDVLDGGAGRDTASYADASSDVLVDLETGNSNIFDLFDPSVSEHDTLRNIEDVEGSAHSDILVGDAGANRLSGGGGSDVLKGGGGDDVLDGGDGTDVLEGGDGADVLSGGAGADTFMFQNSSDADGDSILDFEDGVDLIEITGATSADLSLADADGGTTVTWGDSEFRIVGVQSTDITVDDFAFL